MRIKLAKPIRRDWSRHPAAKGLLLDTDIGVGHGRLKAKLLVFRNQTSLHHFWRHGLRKSNLGRFCLGAVNALAVEVLCVERKGAPEKRWIEADPRYFCVIGLVQGFLSMEIICHEAIHAGFAFAKRKARSPWEAQALQFDEEAVCYPAGAIAAAINRALDKAGLYPESE
jgi:hypothetical protein